MKLHERVRKLQQQKFGSTDSNGAEYSASSFGGFEDYFANKQLKLQNQANQDYTVQSDIFKDCVVYITGYTRPPAQELKRLIIENGGIMCHYLAGKSYATHIVASNLTARKKIEYQKYKVVKPEWVVDSVRQGARLGWAKYRVVTKDDNQRGLVTQANMDCLDPMFIQNYYQQSRLHHLSTWKAELKRKFQLRAKRTNSQPTTSQQPKERAIMHVDFDSFFVAVSLLNHPELTDEAVGVSNSQSGSGDVASCNYKARQFGIKNGMWVSQARKLCPELKIVAYDFEKYEAASNALYECLSEINPDLLFPVSVDEALVDVTSWCGALTRDETLTKLRELRRTIKQESKVEASIGMGPNVLCAKMALRRAKPKGEFIISKQSMLDDLSPVEIESLPGIGRSISKKLNNTGIYTVRELRDLDIHQLERIIPGKLGTKLYEYARGIDPTDISTIPPPKSIGVEIAWAIRLKTPAQVAQFTGNLADELCARMQSQDLTGCQLVAKLYKRREDAPREPPKFLGHGLCDIFTKSSDMFIATNDIDAVAPVAVELVAKFECPAEDVRGIGLQMVRLDGDDDQSPIKPPPLPTRLGEAPKFMTLTQHSRYTKLVAKPDDVDSEVWDALPNDIQRQVARQARTPTPAPPVAKPFDTVVFRYQPVEHLALREWARDTNFPHYQDVCRVEEYFREIAADSDWAKAVEQLRLLKQYAKNKPEECFYDWQLLVNELESVVESILLGRGIRPK